MIDDFDNAYRVLAWSNLGTLAVASDAASVENTLVTLHHLRCGLSQIPELIRTGSIKSSEVFNHEAEISLLEWNYAGNFLATADSSGCIALWESSQYSNQLAFRYSNQDQTDRQEIVAWQWLNPEKQVSSALLPALSGILNLCPGYEHQTTAHFRRRKAKWLHTIA